MNDRLPGTTWDNPVWHGKWRIYLHEHGPHPELGYAFTHDDFDPDADGDTRCGYARSVEEAKAAIDDYDREGDATAAPVFEIPPQYVVDLKWYTPRGDAMIAHMARVSNPSAAEGDPADRLIAYLMRNKHWSPFQMVNMCAEIHTQRDISAQILRHSSFSFQEFSTRYADVEELSGWTECRFQDDQNRQNSFTAADAVARQGRATQDCDSVDDLEVDNTVSYFDAVVNETRVRSLEAYQELRRRGVAKEVARRILPIGLMPTRMYMNGNVRSWLHYIALRTEPGTQKEHRAIAVAVAGLLRSCFPQTFAAALEHGLLKAEHLEEVVLTSPILQPRPVEPYDDKV